MSAALNASNTAEIGRSPGYRPGLLFAGVVLMLCGVFAILAPMLSTLAVTLTVGAASVVGGITQIVHAFKAPAWKGFLLSLLIGLAFLVVGVGFFVWPPAGALAITLTMAWLLLVTGFGEIFLGLRVRGERGWPWLVLSGLLTVAIGMWLMFRIPVTGFFIPGIALGVALLFEGAAFVAMAFGRRRTGAFAEFGPAETADGPRPDRAAGEAPDGEQPVR